MPGNKKPRKPYRPRVPPMRDEQLAALELAARVHVNKLHQGTLDETGWNTLAAHLNVCNVAAKDGRFRPALEALEAIRERHARTGRYGATGDERRTVIEHFNAAVDYLATVPGDRVAGAITTVYQACAG